MRVIMMTLFKQCNFRLIVNFEVVASGGISGYLSNLKGFLYVLLFILERWLKAKN